MAKTSSSTITNQMIGMEIARTERDLVRVGKFGIVVVVMTLISLGILFYKLSTLVAPLNSAEQKLVLVCFGLIVFALLAGFKFADLANYRWAIQEWREQSFRDYQARHRGDKP